MPSSFIGGQKFSDKHSASIFRVDTVDFLKFANPLCDHDSAYNEWVTAAILCTIIVCVSFSGLSILFNIFVLFFR